MIALRVGRNALGVALAMVLLAGCNGANSGLSSTRSVMPFAQPAYTTCVSSPPQYDFIFKGACDGFE